MSCDDYCQLFLGTGMDPSTAVKVLESDGYTSYRNYFQPNGRKQTAWISLVKDELYYIEMRHV
jgi:hypothetical protein